MKSVFLILAIIVSAASVRAATYYVCGTASSPCNGSDSNAGTSKTATWLHAPGMGNCTGSCASYTPAAGDSIIFRGGDTWHTSNSSPSNGVYIGQFTSGCSSGITTCGWQWKAAWSGSSGSPIYIGVDTTWYNSSVCGSSFCRPILNMDNPTSTSLVSSCAYDELNGPIGFSLGQPTGAGAANYVTFDNFEITGGCTTHGEPQYIKVDGMNDIFEHLYLHGWTEIYATGTVNTSGTSVSLASGSNFPCSANPSLIEIPYPNGTEYTISSCSSSSLVLSSSAGTQTGAAYKIGGDQGTLITGAATGTTSPTGVQWTYDVFDGSDTYCTGDHTCSGYAIDAAATYIDHSVFRYIGGASGSNEVIAAHDNLFEYQYESYDNDVHGDLLFTFGTPNPSGTPREFYNNMVRNVTLGQTLSFERNSGAASMYVFNNTFYGIGNGPCINFTIASGSYGGGGDYITNNTLVNCPIWVDYVNGGTQWTINFQNNHWIGYTTQTIAANVVFYGVSADVTLQDNGNEVWQTASQATAQGYTTSNNYQPTSTGGATYQAGGNLSSSCSSYSTDSALCNGSTGGMTNTAGSGTIPTLYIASPPARGSTWDAGAYQYTAGSGLVPAPAAGMFVQNGNQGIVKGQMQP